MDVSGPHDVLVQVVPVGAGTEIGWGANVAERLTDRLDDLRAAVSTGASAVAASLPELPRAKGWELSKVTASFGVTLTAEAGALLSKMSAGATLDVSVTYQRTSSASP
jgi:Trypsin-co-occurring domain 1